MPFDAELRPSLDALLHYARKAGAETADASLSSRESLSVDVRLKELEGVEREEARSIGLRVMIGKQQAGASSSDLSDAGLKDLAERVVAMARLAPEDRYCGLLDPAYRATAFPDLNIFDSTQPSAQQLEDMARACEAASLDVEGVTNSGGAGASWDSSEVLFATSDGFVGYARGASFSLGAQPLAEKGDQKERDYEYRTERFLADLPAPETIGRIAGERAARRLGARKIASCTAPVIFEQRLASRMLGAFFGGISGSAVARGVSFLKDKLGQRVFPDAFEIIEDPFIEKGLASRAFDGEGGRPHAGKLVEAGIVTTWLMNAAAARQLSMNPTGHATLGHGGPPGISTSNLIVKPGSRDLDGLMADAGKGLLVTDMFSPSLNMNTGDWSVGVAGFWFENGGLAHPVSEVTVAGNLLEIYGRLIPGADRDRRGAIDIPSLIVDDLVIGGV
ncbi:MAG: TldD/PmbA family protein [Alphaproteobacteria bacterium]|nr:TldD/PmbA family protein [Alphaproteobacteria bacterium]